MHRARIIGDRSRRHNAARPPLGSGTGRGALQLIADYLIFCLHRPRRGSNVRSAVQVDWMAGAVRERRMKGYRFSRGRGLVLTVVFAVMASIALPSLVRGQTLSSNGSGVKSYFASQSETFKD